jgi:hypothetical protein
MKLPVQLTNVNKKIRNEGYWMKADGTSSRLGGVG